MNLYEVRVGIWADDLSLGGLPPLRPIAAKDAITAIRTAVKTINKSRSERRAAVRADKNLSINKQDEFLAEDRLQDVSISDVVSVKKLSEIVVAE